MYIIYGIETGVADLGKVWHFLVTICFISKNVCDC